MFAVIDRSPLQHFSATSAAQVDLSMGGPVQQVQLTNWAEVPGSNGRQLQAPSADARTAKKWTVQEGSVLVYQPNTASEETVYVRYNATAMPPRLEATFTMSHGTVAAPHVTVVERGNPGPWVRYDPRKDPTVVLYFSIID
jgi:hypothetical protein